MSNRTEQAKSIFLEAIDKVAPEQWPAFLDKACGNDEVLRADVDKLLRAQGQLGSFHEQLPNPADITSGPSTTEQPGAVIAGRYKLLELIGEAGMRAVWIAEQTQPVRRKVAVKLIKAGMDSKQVVARFEAERQALAMMDHPNIAKVLDGGIISYEPEAQAKESSEGPSLALQACVGRPFFVMEYVKGVPITEYCDAARLTIDARLQLFTQVC